MNGRRTSHVTQFFVERPRLFTAIFPPILSTTINMTRRRQCKTMFTTKPTTKPTTMLFLDNVLPPCPLCWVLIFYFLDLLDCPFGLLVYDLNDFILFTFYAKPSVRPSVLRAIFLVIILGTV
jgi:hypothetical protein